MKDEASAGDLDSRSSRGRSGSEYERYGGANDLSSVGSSSSVAGAVRAGNDRDDEDVVMMMDVSRIPGREEQQDSFDSPKFTLSDLAEMSVADAPSSEKESKKVEDAEKEGRTPPRRKLAKKESPMPSPIRVPSSMNSPRRDGPGASASGVRAPTLQSVQCMEKAVRAAGLAAGFGVADVTRIITGQKFVPNMPSVANLGILLKLVQAFALKVRLDTMENPPEELVREFETATMARYFAPASVVVSAGSTPSSMNGDSRLAGQKARPRSGSTVSSVVDSSPGSVADMSPSSRRRALSTVYLVGAAKDAEIPPGSIYREALARKYPSLKPHFENLNQQQLSILPERRAASPAPMSPRVDGRSAEPSPRIGRSRSPSTMAPHDHRVEVEADRVARRKAAEEAEWLSAVSHRLAVIKKMGPSE